MDDLDKITFGAAVMGGKPCIHGMRVTVGTIVGLIAVGKTEAEIIDLYPYIESEDIMQGLAYASWRPEEVELPISHI